MQNTDEYFMTLALKEAEKGLGFTSPNPVVGAVITKDDKIISTGFHQKRGTDHAEVVAIKNAHGHNLNGAAMYVTLEPCCHHGLTPPCTEAIIQSGIKTVYIASNDIDSRVKGKSINILKNSGIKVITGIMKKEADCLNSIYFFHKKMKRPYIALKAALTLDGMIADTNFDSKWISNDKSRHKVHRYRSIFSSIAVGMNTVKRDRPMLNCRLENFQNKKIDKLVFTNSRIFNYNFADNPGSVYLIDDEKSKNSEVFLHYVNQLEIDSILVEGGSCVYDWFLKNNLVDRILLFYRPAFMGVNGLPFYKSQGVEKVNKLRNYNIDKCETIDDNIFMDLYKGEKLCLPGL